MKQFYSYIFLIFLSFQGYSQVDVGQMAPDFTGTDDRGVKHQLYDHLTQGQWVLLKMGWINCAPCHESNWGTNVLYHAFGCNDDELVVLEIDPIYTTEEYDTYWESWDQWADPGTIGASHTLSTHYYPVITVERGGESIYELYGSPPAPTFFLINPEGLVVAGGPNPNIFNSLINFQSNVIGVFQYLVHLGIDSKIDPLGASLYIEQNVDPNIASDNFSSVPFSEFCEDGIAQNDECDDEIASNIQITVDQSINEMVATWEGGGDCTGYEVSVYTQYGPIWKHRKTVTGTSVTFSDLEPGRYFLEIVCNCNDTYTSSDLVSFVIDYDQIITDFTDGECADVCNYTLTLSNGANFEPIDWQTYKFYLELIVDGKSGGFWLTGSDYDKSWEITACTGANIQAKFHADKASGSFLTIGQAEAKLETSNEEVVFDVTAESYLEVENLAKEEAIIFTGLVNCSIECNPQPIPEPEVTTDDPPNVTTIDWEDQPHCQSYTIRYKAGADAFDWSQATTTESIYDIPFVIASLGAGQVLEYQIRCNCEGGGVGPFSESFQVTLPDHECESFGAPETPVLEFLSPTIATVSWVPSQNASCDYYYIKLDPVSGEGLSFGLASSLPSYTFEGLDPNTEYEVSVACVCDFEESGYSNSLFFTTPAAEDCRDVIIDNVSVTDVYATNALVSWEPNDYCTEYVVRYISEGETLWKFETVSSDMALIEGLVPGGQYTVQVRCKCEEATGVYSDEVSFSTITATMDIQNDALLVYPNPSKNILNIHVNQNSVDRIVLLDIFGRKVLDESTLANGSDTVIDISDLNSGVYILHGFLGNSEKYVSKVVVQ